MKLMGWLDDKMQNQFGNRVPGGVTKIKFPGDVQYSAACFRSVR